MKVSKSVIFVLIILILSSIALAIPFVPQGDIVGKDTYSIYDFVDINASFFYMNGSLVLTTASGATDTIWDISTSEWLINTSGILDWNETKGNITFLNLAGGTMTGNLNLSDNQLTDVGALIMNGLVTSQNITPASHNLYNLGSSDAWFANAWITNVYSNMINTSTLNSSQVNTDNVDVAENLSIGGFKVHNNSGDLVVVLV